MTTGIRIQDVPFGGRPYNKFEAILLADLGSRVPQGAGDCLLVYNGADAYLYVPNSTLTGWITFLLASNNIGSYSKVIKDATYDTIAGAYNAVYWTVESADTIGGFDLGASLELFTAPVTGVYQHNVSLLVNMASGTQDIEIRFANGAGSIKHQLNYPNVSTDLQTISFTVIQAMTALETRKVLMNIPSGTLNFQGVYCLWEVVRLS